MLRPQSRRYPPGIDAPCVLASRRPASASRRVITLKEALRVGVDIIEIERVERALTRPGFRERCFTEAEREYCDSRTRPAQSYAARFAGKEAVGKALGCGVRFTWKEIEIVGRPKPSVRLSGRTAAWAERTNAGAIDLSMTHSRELAAAICVVADAGV
jgi:holo-[acyl-carrier protein] synthase